MIKSINTKVDLTKDSTWFRSIPSYGKVMIGDKAFEFYSDHNVMDFVQIPWKEITYVVADVKFHGKYIPRFEIRTKANDNFIFTTKNPKETLRAIRKYISADHMRRSLPFWQGLKQRFIHKNK